MKLKLAKIFEYLKLFKAGPRETLGRRMKWKVGSTRGILCVLQTYFSGLKNKFVSPSLLANGFEGMMHIVTFFYFEWLNQVLRIVKNQHSFSPAYRLACLQSLS